jgi:hypothetical protein
MAGLQNAIRIQCISKSLHLGKLLGTWRRAISVALGSLCAAPGFSRVVLLHTVLIATLVKDDFASRRFHFQMLWQDNA